MCLWKKKRYEVTDWSKWSSKETDSSFEPKYTFKNGSRSLTERKTVLNDLKLRLGKKSNSDSSKTQNSLKTVTTKTSKIIKIRTPGQEVEEKMKRYFSFSIKRPKTDPLPVSSDKKKKSIELNNSLTLRLERIKTFLKILSAKSDDKKNGTPEVGKKNDIVKKIATEKTPKPEVVMKKVKKNKTPKPEIMKNQRIETPKPEVRKDQKIETPKPEVIKKTDNIKRPETVVKKVDKIATLKPETVIKKNDKISTPVIIKKTSENYQKPEASFFKIENADSPKPEVIKKLEKVNSKSDRMIKRMLEKLNSRSRSASPRRLRVKSLPIKLIDKVDTPTPKRKSLRKVATIIKVLKLRLPSPEIYDDTEGNIVKEPEVPKCEDDEDAIGKQFWKALHGVTDSSKKLRKPSNSITKKIRGTNEPLIKIELKQSLKSLEYDETQDILSLLEPAKDDKTFNPYALQLPNDRKDDFPSGMTFQRSNLEDTIEWNRLYKNQTKHKFKFEMVDPHDLNISPEEDQSISNRKSAILIKSDTGEVISAIKSDNEEFVFKALKVDLQKKSKC